MTDTTRPSPQPGIVTCEVADTAALHAAYMPFITNGGLFLPAKAISHNYQLGDEVFVLLNLVEQGERLPVAGQVIWVTPPSTQGGRIQGMGIAFSRKDRGATRAKIETLLAGRLGSDQGTPESLE